jgi:NADPH2:quinone reductase
MGVVRAALVDPAERRIVLADVPAPAPGPEQLLVRVRAAGVNRADLAVLAGTYHATAAASPFVAGAELAGEVVQIGSAVSGWRPGDRVMAMGRGYAELAVVDVALAMPVPDALDWAAAGALPVALATMHDALVTHGRCAPGHHVVVNAASSGVGVVGVLMAVHLGAATVIGTSRSADKRALLGRLVGDERFVAVAPDELVAVADERTGGRGIDVIVDNVGGSALDDNIAAAAIGGRIVQVGRLGGRRATIDLDELARKRIELIGVTFRTRTPAERAAVAHAAWTAMGDAVATGAVVPHVHAGYALDDVAVAHQALARDAHVGKLVILP